MTVKLIDIARIAGVSKSTASRALCGSPLVNEDTRQRVLETARELKYRPNSLARAMATKKTGIIGFLIYKKGKPYIGHTFFGPVLDGAFEEARKRGYHIILSAADSIEDTFDEHFIQDSIDGALLVSFYPNEVIKEFKRRGIPLAIINVHVESENNAFILDDNYNGACAIMKHLINEKGHKSIAHITEDFDHPSYLARYQAYLDTHALYNIPINGELVFTPGTSFQDGTAAMSRILSNKTLPTAVFAVTDSLALGAMKAIKASGLRIPEDIAVAGYDDIDAARISDPPLTTVCVDRESIGKAAVTALMDQIADPGKPSRTITIKNKLIVREST